MLLFPSKLLGSETLDFVRHKNIGKCCIYPFWFSQVEVHGITVCLSASGIYNMDSFLFEVHMKI